MQNKYYVYAYLNDDKTPYYIGKGCGSRITDYHGSTPIPEKEENRIMILEGLTNDEAFAIESLLIDSLGRENIDKDGILKNIQPGRFSPDKVENFFKLQDKDCKRKDKENKYYISMMEGTIEEYQDHEYDSELCTLFDIQKNQPEYWNQIYSDYCKGYYKDTDKGEQIEIVIAIAIKKQLFTDYVAELEKLELLKPAL
jgi:hypothetical protein